jgi:hypothetical protein
VVNREKKSKTMKFSIIISVIFSIAIILLILLLTTDARTFNYLATTSIQYEFFFMALLLQIFSWFIWGARLKVLSNASDKTVTIGLWESTKIVIANLFLAGITPSMAGGEPVRIYLLNKNGLSVGSATASVLGERVLDAIFILLCVPFAFFVFSQYIDVLLIQIGLVIGIVVFIIGIVLFAITVKYPNKTKSFLIFLSNKISKLFKKKKIKYSIKNKINTEVDNFHKSIIFFISGEKKVFFIVGSLTIAYWATIFMIPSMILLGLGLEPFFIPSYAAQVLLIVIIMMPTTPGSAGVTEGVIAVMYGALISSSFLIGVFVLIFRFITFHINLIVGVIFQYRIFKSVASFSLDVIKKKQ